MIKNLLKEAKLIAKLYFKNHFSKSNKTQLDRDLWEIRHTKKSLWKRKKMLY